MTEATLTWTTWQALLQAFAHSFTRRGFRRFAEWITAMALTLRSTPSPSPSWRWTATAWKALETFAEYGGWHEGRVTYDLTRLVEAAPGRTWHGYIASAVYDTKVHRSSPHVQGTCTFHEYTARCPNRAGTVRAHNWLSSVRCSTSRESRAGSARSPAGSTSVRRSCPPAPAAR